MSEAFPSRPEYPEQEFKESTPLPEAGGTERRRSRSGVPPASTLPERTPDASSNRPAPVHDEPGDPVDDFPESDLDPEEESSVDERTEDPSSQPRPSGWQLGVHKKHGRRLVKPQPTLTIGPEQRLLLLDIWKRSALPAGDFAALVGLSKHTLYAWKKRFDTEGPAGLMDQPRGAPKGSRLPDLTQRTILMLKQANPDWGCQRISDMLLRGPALPASPQAVAHVLHEAGYELEEVPTRPHPDKVRRFERSGANELWQTDLFTFILKRQNRRVYLVAFLDDHSRFVVGYGLHASQSTPLVLEVLRAALTNYGAPQEILTDNGSQYITWRGKSAFSRELEKRGIRQIVASPRRPQTLGKIERFWGSLWRECLEAAVFIDLGDATRRIGQYIDHYNFQRPHRGIDGLIPADRFFGAAPEVLKTLRARVAANALELARHGIAKPPFYLTGQVGGQPFSVHAEGERVILTESAGQRREIDLTPPSAPAADFPVPVCPAAVVTSLTADAGSEQSLPPGVSPLDAGLKDWREQVQQGGDA